MCETLKEEFTLSNFKLNYHNRRPFYTSQWQWNPRIYLAIRTLLAVYTFGAYILVLSLRNKSKHPVLIYLTHWAYCLLIVYFIVSAATTLYCYYTQMRDVTSGENDQTSLISVSSNKGNGTYNSIEGDTAYETDGDTGNVAESYSNKNKSNQGDNLSWYLKLTWALGNIVHPVSVIVTIIFFFLILPNTDETPRNLFSDLNVHIFNGVFALFDAAIIARPTRLLHVIYPESFGILYMVANVIYWSIDPKHDVVYSIIDWNKPDLSVSGTLILLMVILPLFQLLFYGIYRLRLVTYKRLYGHDYRTMVND